MSRWTSVKSKFIALCRLSCRRPMPTEEQCREAVQALYRVRAVEKPPGPDGRREIWHQGAKYSELLSTVDATGRLEEQEFVLFREVLRWQRGGGMRTGKLAADAPDVSSRSNVSWDAQPSPVRLFRSKKALASYTGDDAYLKHLRDAISAELAGIAWDDRRVVTKAGMPGDSEETYIPMGTGLWERLRGLFGKKR
jgi:hypothetical protein